MRDYKNNKIHTVRTTNLTSSRTSDDYDKDYYSIKGGYYYILEVARKVTPENKAKFALDERRIICGHERIVSVHRLYVSRIIYENKRYVLQCVGTNRCGQRVDGTYFFYQTPIFSDDRDNFILSIIPDDRSLKKRWFKGEFSYHDKWTLR